MSVALYTVAFGGALLLVLSLVQQRRKSLLPPGPPGDPVVGHLLRMPSADSPLIFHQWSKIYGPVMHLKVLGRSMVILDTYQAAVDLLDKRGSIYSDRPKLTLYELLGWKPSLPFLQYGKQFNTQRQMHQTYLSRHKVENYKPMQTQEARMLVRNLLESAPERHEEFLSRFATGIITQIVAGHRITSDADPYLRMSSMVYEAMSKTGPPGSSPLDFFPLRECLLLLRFDEYHLYTVQHFPPWFPGTKHMGVEAGVATPSFILEQLEQMKEVEDMEQLKGAAAAMFAAGEATVTWSSLCIFILAMIQHPEFQDKAQKEIDAVVGNLRLPEFRDRSELPFVEGILQETLRWRPAVPLGVPHRVMEDNIYHGMLIPKGSLVFPNIKGMSLDESVYSTPTSFRPERYLPKPAGKGEPYFNNVAFGFGRRICTGRYFADNSLWIAIVSILATCRISNMVDESGKIIVPDSSLTDGIVSHPRDIRCIISPRSAGTKELIMETVV
ncbi:O-methylsterigmatocystin oxidoreductase [Mycena venus]|uniref:O-methylsterigmatocystin oxidoreductase n=1 Tax=Mycena venus TaxID=2733690 RepID=A0A8H7CVQ1_9AGAR|nr:O-methylsterigmatocystin oxidoreductase [Mycena venus]